MQNREFSSLYPGFPSGLTLQKMKTVGRFIVFAIYIITVVTVTLLLTGCNKSPKKHELELLTLSAKQAAEKAHRVAAMAGQQKEIAKKASLEAQQLVDEILANGNVQDPNFFLVSVQKRLKDMKESINQIKVNAHNIEEEARTSSKLAGSISDGFSSKYENSNIPEKAQTFIQAATQDSNRAIQSNAETRKNVRLAEEFIENAEEAVRANKKSPGSLSLRKDSLKGDIDIREIPALPVLPKIIQVPKGTVGTLRTETKLPPSNKDEIWEQVSSGSEADFLPGGYSASKLTFHANGILEVQRSFGKKSEVVIMWRLRYKWNKDRTEIAIGQDENQRIVPDSLKGFTIEEFGISAQAAIRTLPTTLPYQRMENKQIHLGEKVCNLLRN